MAATFASCQKWRQLIAGRQNLALSKCAPDVCITCPPPSFPPSPSPQQQQQLLMDQQLLAGNLPACPEKKVHENNLPPFNKLKCQALIICEPPRKTSRATPTSPLNCLLGKPDHSRGQLTAAVKTFAAQQQLFNS